MITSATPRIRAASRSSRVRVLARSSSATREPSLQEPRSPREPQITTTRAPASERRASVPPQASDSSSGWAKTARIVRPEKSGASGMRPSVDDSLIHGEVLVDHAFHAESRDGLLADAPAIQTEHARKSIGHLIEIAEDHAGDRVVHHFAYSAAVEGSHRSAAGHGFCQHQAKRFSRLNGVEQGSRPAIELHLSGKV